MARYITDVQLAALPSLEGLDDAQRAAVLRNAERLYRWVRSNEFTRESRLREWAEAQGMTPDDINRALQNLVEAKRLHTLADADGQQPPAPAATPTAQAEILHAALNELSRDQVVQLAADQGVETTTRTTKTEAVTELALKAGAPLPAGEGGT